MLAVQIFYSAALSVQIFLYVCVVSFSLWFTKIAISGAALTN